MPESRNGKLVMHIVISALVGIICAWMLRGHFQAEYISVDAHVTSPDYIEYQLFWKEGENGFDEARSVKQRNQIAGREETLHFLIYREEINGLRLNFKTALRGQEIRQFDLRSMEINGREVLPGELELQTNDAAVKADGTGLEVEVTGDNPFIVFPDDAVTARWQPHRMVIGEIGLGLLAAFCCYCLLASFSNEKDTEGETNHHSHTGLEILRVLSMFAIVVQHYLTFGQVNVVKEPYAVSYWIGWFYRSFFVFVNCFVLTTGYFLIRDKRLRFKKVLWLWLPVFFYSVAIYMGASALGMQDITASKLWEIFMPFRYDQYWFMTCYIALYLLHPWLAKIADGMTEKEYRKYLFILLMLTSIWPAWQVDRIGTINGYSLLWFISLYYLGGYIRLFGKDYGIAKPLAVYVLAAMSAFLPKYLFWRYDNPDYNLWSYMDFLFNYNCLPIVIGGVALFLVFRNIQVKNFYIRKLVYTLSPLVLGVYLIHENNVIRPLLWNLWTKAPAFAKSDWTLFVPYWIATSVVIFVAAAVIEWVRQRIFDVLGINRWLAK